MKKFNCYCILVGEFFHDLVVIFDTAKHDSWKLSIMIPKHGRLLSSFWNKKSINRMKILDDSYQIDKDLMLIYQFDTQSFPMCNSNFGEIIASLLIAEIENLLIDPNSDLVLNDNIYWAQLIIDFPSIIINAKKRFDDYLELRNQKLNQLRIYLKSVCNLSEP